MTDIFAGLWTGRRVRLLILSFVLVTFLLPALASANGGVHTLTLDANGCPGPLTTAPERSNFSANASVFFKLQCTMAGYVGGRIDIAGAILGTALSMVLAIAVTWVITAGKGSSGTDTGVVFMFSLVFGVVIATVLGWFSLWVILLLVIIAALLIMKPFGSGGALA